MKENIFLPADILLPKDADMHKWAVIACDQFTSDQAYWDRVRATAGDAPSTINLILPEAELGTEKEAEHTALINRTMEQYVAEGVFETYADSFVYVERTLENGTIRKGLIGKLDLDAYDYNVGSTSAVRATEKTVVERIPPRQRVRRNAPIELPHILMLCDDHEKVLIEPVAAKKDQLKKLYDFDLMEGGGHITGWLVPQEEVEKFNAVLAEYSANVGKKYEGLKGEPVVFAVGDGNHSLATAKSCYEELKKIVPDRERALAYVKSFDFDAWSAEMTDFLGKGAEPMIALEAKEGKYDREKHKARLDTLLSRWEEIRKEICTLPRQAEIDRILDAIGAPKTAGEMGIDRDTVPVAFRRAGDIRDKYVLPRLLWDLGVAEEFEAKE